MSVFRLPIGSDLTIPFFVDSGDTDGITATAVMKKTYSNWIVDLEVSALQPASGNDPERWDVYVPDTLPDDTPLGIFTVALRLEKAGTIQITEPVRIERYESI